MMAKALDANGAAKVYIVGRRLEKLQQVVQQAVRALLVCQNRSQARGEDANVGLDQQICCSHPGRCHLKRESDGRRRTGQVRG